MASEYIGLGNSLHLTKEHPYIGQKDYATTEQKKQIIKKLNENRVPDSGPCVEVDYYFEVTDTAAPLEGITNAAKMVIEHGTIKPWHLEGDKNFDKPKHYDEFMSWVLDIKLLGFNGQDKIESGIVTIAYPLMFFDKTPNEFPFAQLMMAIASEPFSAFSFYQGAKIIDVRFPKELISKFPKRVWSNRKVREYLMLDDNEPIIGTIVKPKAGLSPELFASCVVEAALAGAKFTKSDENLHLTIEEITIYFSHTVNELKKAGFDLGKPGDKVSGKRFIFAPHITAAPHLMMARADAAVAAGVNALMFSPYYCGGFHVMSEISRKHNIPVYPHTAGMNVMTGSLRWGIDPSFMYRMASYYGGAFMQLTATKGYLKPDDTEKVYILEKLNRDGLIGADGMTLAIAGGLGPANIGSNMRDLGEDGKMFLAGTSVYSHPDGATAGVHAIILAYRAYKEKGLTEKDELINYAKSLGKEGLPLLRAIQ